MKNSSIKVDKLKIIALILSFGMAFNIISMKKTEKEPEKVKEKKEKRKNIFEDEQELSRTKSVKLDDEKSYLENLPLRLQTIITEFVSDSTKTAQEIEEIVKQLDSLALVSNRFKIIIQSDKFQNYLFRLAQNNISKLLMLVVEIGTPYWADKLKNFVEHAQGELEEEIQQKLSIMLISNSYFGNIDKVKFLLKEIGVNPNNIYQFTPNFYFSLLPQDFDSTSALINAIKKGHTKVVELLLEAGANLNFINRFYGNIALAQAVKYGNKNMVELLLNNGVDLNTSTKFAFILLMEAVQHKRKEIVELLLNRGVTVDYQDDVTGETALMLAVRLKGRKEIVKLLLAAHADLNIQDNDGNTALIIAVRVKAGKEIIKLLLAAGADLKIRNNNGLTALSIAQQKNYESIAQILEAKFMDNLEEYFFDD